MKLLASRALNASLFEGHPYGTTEYGTVQGLTAITLDDVKEYYAKTYTQANLWFGIAGGYPASIVKTIRKDFSALPAGEFKQVVLAKPEEIKNMEVTVVEKPTRAYAVSMGYPINLTRKDKDFLRASCREFLLRRASHVQRRFDEPPARRPRIKLRRLFLYRKICRRPGITLPGPQHAAAAAILQHLASPGTAGEHAFRDTQCVVRIKESDGERF